MQDEPPRESKRPGCQLRAARPWLPPLRLGPPAGRSDAQMMLLTAFVLVLGFVALSGMVARVAQLSEETRQATDRPIYTESQAVARGIESMLERINDVTAVDEAEMDDYPQEYLANVNAAAAHMERLESARGFRLKFVDDPPISCNDSGGVVIFTSTFSLTDVDTRITFTASYELKPAAASDPMDPPLAYTSCFPPPP